MMRAGESLTNSTYRQRCHLDSSIARAELNDLVARGLVDLPAQRDAVARPGLR